MLWVLSVQSGAGRAGLHPQSEELGHHSSLSPQPDREGRGDEGGVRGSQAGPGQGEGEGEYFGLMR